jgi:hypothetical protein
MTYYVDVCRVHPLHILLAMKAYERGRQDKSSKAQWKPNLDVVAALETAFYKSFAVSQCVVCLKNSIM